MSILGIIPARYASTRFPAKPLADIGGKSMIQRVYEQTKKAKFLSRVVVATDHPIIYDHLKKIEADVVMTKQTHPSGTDRCCEVLLSLQEKYQYVINIQGDEPFIQPEQIDLLATALNGQLSIGTLIKKISDSETLFNPNVVKAVTAHNGTILYFSRAPIPHVRSVPEADWIHRTSFYKHIGMYAYRADVLIKLAALPVSSLEQAESLEQLRWLDHGFSIKAIETTLETISIDTPEDLQKALANTHS